MPDRGGVTGVDFLQPFGVVQDRPELPGEQLGLLIGELQMGQCRDPNSVSSSQAGEASQDRTIADATPEPYAGLLRECEGTVIRNGTI